MPQRSKIEILPLEIRQEFEKKLLSDGFRNYDEFPAWFAERGYVISRSTAHRSGQSFESKISAIKASTDMAIALADHVGDDAGKMNDAVVRMYQEKLFHVLLDMEEIDPGNIDFIKLGRAIAEVTKSSVSQKKWMAEIRTKTKQTADDVGKIAKAGGMSESTAKEIRQRILGIV